MQLKPRLVYSPKYNFRFWGLEKLHPFDGCKFRRAYRELRARGLARSSCLRPRRIDRQSLLAVHSPEYLAQLRDAKYVARVIEVPFVARLPGCVVRHVVLQPMLYATGGTLLATRESLRHGIAVNLGGGFHHAARDRGEGFCAYADVAVAIEALRRAGPLGDVIIVDLDAHQGNGLERIYRSDPRVSIFDMYNRDVYPGDAFAREGITWDLPLESGCGDQEYLALLRARLPSALDACRPALAFFIAGTDVFGGDPLGGLALSAGGILERDVFVTGELAGRGIPMVMVLGGGYTRFSYRLVANSIAEIFRRHGAPGGD